MANLNLLKPHPWHGVDLYLDKKHEDLQAFIEITPDDRMKYEIDKKSGYLRVDRPQKYSNILPCLYGFLPQTYCAEQTAALATERPGLQGDLDPLDICIFSQGAIGHGNILVSTRVIGGFQMIDDGEVDDKIIAILIDDPVYGSINSINDFPKPMITKLKHYFLTYKLNPDNPNAGAIEIPLIYDRAHAMHVVESAHKDYKHHFQN